MWLGPGLVLVSVIVAIAVCGAMVAPCSSRLVGDKSGAGKVSWKASLLESPRVSRGWTVC